MTALPDPDETPVLTVEETAKILRLSRGSTYNGVHAGEIPSIMIGGRILVPTRKLLEMFR